MALHNRGLHPYRDVNVQAADSSYTFTSPSSPDAPALVVDRPTGDLHLNDGVGAAGSRPYRVTSINGILGIIQLRLDKYIIVVTKAQPMGRFKGHMVYRVAGTEILSLRKRQIRDPDEDAFLALLQASLKNGPMYFSYSIDLTNSFQRQAGADNTLPLWMRTDDRFFWNRFIQSDLINFRTKGARGQPGPQPAVDPYILPVIFGMFEIKQTTFRGTPLSLILVSRRSRHRGGTRYFTRGIDDKGNVANYNETEQIVIFNDNAGAMGGFAGGSDMQTGQGSGSASGKETEVYSYVQTRGSVPTYWAEINSLRYVPKLQLRGTETAFAAARAHFDEQIRIYGDNYLVNLVNQKGRERNVKESYEQMVEMLVSSPKERVEADQITEEKFHTIHPTKTRQEYDRLHYVYFDFHNETKGMQMQRAMLLIDKLAAALDQQGYFCGVDMLPAAGDLRLEVRSQQTSVMRTNCMDCLDRTNVVQSMFARHMLDSIFVRLGLMPAGSTFRDHDAAFEFIFRNLWADNADVVSNSYAGTGAMKTDLTRMGKRTKAGALQDARVGVTRYYKNNFCDGPRQDSYDLFLGVYLPGQSIGTSTVFGDRRPVLIQAVPWILAFSTFVLLFALFAPRDPSSSSFPRRMIVLVFLVIAGWSFNFVRTHGMLYVNWPRLAPRPYATEGFNEHIVKAGKDSLIGPFVARHERGASIVKYRNAEEGKED